MVFILLISFIPLVEAIRINEVELNPEGTDNQNEWIELYSEDTVNLEAWKLKNNDGDWLDLNAEFSGYYVVTLTKQWLDNEDEKVLLYDNDDNLIDETIILKDTKNNFLAWSFCGAWEFIDSTKGQRNGCDYEETQIEDEEQEQIETEVEEQEQEAEEEEQQEDEQEDAEPSEQSQEKITITKETITQQPEIIKLNYEDDQEQTYQSQTTKINNFIFPFLSLLILLIILYFLIAKLKH